jgi:hypothetical protein
MAQELAMQASAGEVVLLLLMMVSMYEALVGAAGDRSHQPTLVAGPLTASGSSRRRAARALPNGGRAAVWALRTGRALPLGHLRHTR